MIDIISNNTSFRKVPHQSGIYQLDLTIQLDNHNNDVTFFLSGGGSTFFAFGANSGNYFASGNNKLFFENTTPNVSRTYSFVIGPGQFDVYNQSDVALILGAAKTSGLLERIYLRTTAGAAGEFSILLNGNQPSFQVQSGITFATSTFFNNQLVVTNLSDVPFNILSGTLDSLNFVSGANRLPIFIGAFSSGTIPFSGHIQSEGQQFRSLILNADYGDFNNVIAFTGSPFSGSGYTFTVPDAQEVSLGNFSNVAFLVQNTGTEYITFVPQVTNITRAIPIAPPSYTGIAVPNLFSGYFDTEGKFFFSDNIVWSGGAFNIIEEVQSNFSFINITGESLVTGLFFGSNTNSGVGQTINLPFDFALTGCTLKLAATGETFISTDVVFAQVFAGQGVTGSILGTSTQILCSTIPSGIISGTGFTFAFNAPILLSSGTNYSIVLTGNSEWVGNTGASPVRSVILLQNTGNPYPSGSGFRFDSSGVFYTGDAILNVSWFIPTGARRYLVNTISGNTSSFARLTTGNYYKYMADKNFVFSDPSITVAPDDTAFFRMTYTGVVSGLNIVNLQFLGTTFNQNISGVTD